MITGDSDDLDFKDIKEVFIMTQQHKRHHLKDKKKNPGTPGTPGPVFQDPGNPLDDENVYVEHKPGEYKYPDNCTEKFCQIYVKWSTNSNDQVDFVVIGRNTSSINVVLSKGKNEKVMEDGNDVISGYSNRTVFDAHLKG
jgi:hypothetical protein